MCLVQTIFGCITLVIHENYQFFFKNALGQFTSNCPPKHVSTNAYRFIKHAIGAFQTFSE